LAWPSFVAYCEQRGKTANIKEFLEQELKITSLFRILCKKMFATAPLVAENVISVTSRRVVERPSSLSLAAQALTQSCVVTALSFAASWCRGQCPDVQALVRDGNLDIWPILNIYKFICV
jgi:hypothetical protein